MIRGSFLLISIFALGLASCSRGPSVEIGEVVVANKTSTSYLEWTSSDLNPENKIKKLLSEGHSEESICQSLLQLNSEDLTIFEDVANKFKSSCKLEVQNKISLYWQLQDQLLRELYGNAGLIKFPDSRVVLRDISRGYVTTSAELHPKEVLITFDDGPHPKYTPSILKTLSDYNVRSLFFFLGQNAKKYPQLVHSAGQRGHSIASHTMSHKCLPQTLACKNNNKGKVLTLRESAQELKSAHKVIFDILGWIDPFVRLPYGATSLPIRNFLMQNSTAEIIWNVDSEDWKSTMTPKKMIQSVMRQLSNVKSGIVLFHDIQKRTEVTLPYFLAELHKQGYQPVILQALDPDARYNSKLIESQDPLP